MATVPIRLKLHGENKAIDVWVEMDVSESSCPTLLGCTIFYAPKTQSIPTPGEASYLGGLECVVQGQKRLVECHVGPRSVTVALYCQPPGCALVQLDSHHVVYGAPETQLAHAVCFSAEGVASGVRLPRRELMKYTSNVATRRKQK